jgi:rod shape-determining protein MreD
VSRWRPAAVTAAVLVAAIVAQVVVFNRLDLPGAAPDVMLAAVIAAALAHGATHGATAGFAGGLLVDLAPPADHPAGLWALALTLTGFVAGSVADARDRDLGLPPRVIALAGLLGSATTALVLGLAAALGEPTPGAGRAGQLVVTAGAYNAVLAGLVVWAFRALLRWSTDTSIRRLRRPIAGRAS